MFGGIASVASTDFSRRCDQGVTAADLPRVSRPLLQPGIFRYLRVTVGLQLLCTRMRYGCILGGHNLRTRMHRTFSLR